MELNRTYDAAIVNSIMRQMQGIPDGGESAVEGETPLTLTRAMAAHPAASHLAGWNPHHHSIDGDRA